MSRILEAFLKNQTAIKRLLARYRLGKSDIEDLAQEIFIKGFAAETRTEIGDPKAFLFRIARNTAVTHLRKGKHSAMDALEEMGGADVVLDDGQSSAEEKLDGRRKIMLFTEAVAHLPPQCRKAFLMRRVEGLAFKQIAVRMDISISSAEKHVKNGLLKCSAYLRAQGYEPAEFGDRTPKAVSESSSVKDGKERSSN